MQKPRRCFNLNCVHFDRILKEKNRHFINSQKYNNCVLCLVNGEGSFSQEEIGTLLGLTKMRICQLEKRALQKFVRRMMKLGWKKEDLQFMAFKN